ncbi:hypothetical protein BT96DRAFT_237367 [Gymnopus androsaceus JB14]|uniref:RNI-like protein n=1 Tax=Gymnopus androsaceus JB14 TaxID=1447944 RepID=A0A6A4IJW2_9AGAR|nr:hypothetical protein BT96DRAFT_237367 [Gymnopus androsaceus JB14]
MHNMAVLFDILTLCPRVKSLSYSFQRFHRSTLNQTSPPPQISKSVSCLEIRLGVDWIPKRSDDNSDIFGILLPSCHFPTLQRLSIIYNDDHCGRFFNAERVTEFLLRSKCFLTTLQIEDAIISDGDLINILRNTPELQHLSFYENPLQSQSGRNSSNDNASKVTHHDLHQISLCICRCRQE